MPRIPDELIERLKQTTDLVAVINDILDIHTFHDAIRRLYPC